MKFSLFVSTAAALQVRDDQADQILEVNNQGQNKPAQGTLNEVFTKTPGGMSITYSSDADGANGVSSDAEGAAYRFFGEKRKRARCDAVSAMGSAIVFYHSMCDAGICANKVDAGEDVDVQSLDTKPDSDTVWIQDNVCNSFASTMPSCKCEQWKNDSGKWQTYAEKRKGAAEKNQKEKTLGDDFQKRSE